MESAIIYRGLGLILNTANTKVQYASATILAIAGLYND
jgi:hypothetical protein